MDSVLPPVLLALLLLGATPARAGTPADPEVADTAGDHVINPLGAAELMPSPVYPAADLLALWIDDETAHDLRVNLKVAEIPFMPAISSVYEIHFNVLGRPYVAGIVGQDFMSDPVYRPRGVAETVHVEGNVFTFNVQKANIGSPVAGDLATGFYVTSAIGPAAEQVVLVTDRAPDDGVGRDYRFIKDRDSAVQLAAGENAMTSNAAVPASANSTAGSSTGPVAVDSPGLAPSLLAVAMLAMVVRVRRRPG